MIILKFDILNDSQWLQMFNKSELRYFTRLSETFGIIEIYSLQSNRSKMIYIFFFSEPLIFRIKCYNKWNLCAFMEPTKKEEHT